MVLHQPHPVFGDRGSRFAARRELIRHRLRRGRPSLAAIDHRIARSLGPGRRVHGRGPPSGGVARTRRRRRADRPARPHRRRPDPPRRLPGGRRDRHLPPAALGASGILNTAVAMGRPMIGSDHGCIGDTIRAFGLGAVLDRRDPERMSAALTKLVASPPTLDVDRSRPLARFHTIENQRRVLRSCILGEISPESPPVPFPPIAEAPSGSIPETHP